MDRTCKNCKRWGKGDGWRIPEDDMKSCGGVRNSNNIYREPILPNELAITVSYEESALYTRENFFCTLFEGE